MILRILSYIKPYRRYTILAMLCVAVECVFELVIPLIMANIVDIGVANGDMRYIFAQSGLMCLCALLALILGMGSAKFSAIAGQGLGAELRRAEYQKIQSFSFANCSALARRSKFSG